MQKINGTKSWLFVKINKTDKSLLDSSRKKRALKKQNHK